jgi:SnoaL-like domain
MTSHLAFDARLTRPGDRRQHTVLISSTIQTKDGKDMNTTQITEPSQTFDAGTFRQGIEERDAQLLLGLYAQDAELHIVDCDHQPSQPRIVRGRAAIGEYFADVCGRDMTHKIERLVVGADHAAFIQACTYPNGTKVLCVAVLDLADGLITRLTGIQAWDQ